MLRRPWGEAQRGRGAASATALTITFSLVGLISACSDTSVSAPKSESGTNVTDNGSQSNSDGAPIDEGSGEEPAGATKVSTARVPSGPLKRHELGWLRDYARWRDGTLLPLNAIWMIRDRWKYYLLDRDYENRPVSRYRHALPTAERCSRSLRRDVGAPGARFRQAFAMLRTGCAAFERAAASDDEAFRARDADGLVASDGDWSAGFLAAEQAAEAVHARLTENRKLPVVRGRSSKSRIVPGYSHVATDLVLFDQQVRCWSRRDWKAILREERVFWNGAPTSDIIGMFGARDRVHLAPEICKGLDVLTHSERRPRSGSALIRVALAVETLAHEAEHRRGTANEAITECRAAQRTRKAAKLLGASRSYAALLAETFWSEIYPYKPAEYRTAACRDDGPLDLRPASSVWP